MVRNDVRIPLPDAGELAATLVLPEPAPQAAAPGVIVLHEIFGPQPEILEVAERFAERGYIALAPDLFSAGIRLACLTRAMRESSSGRPGRTTEIIEAARAWLAARDDVDEQRLAVIGFCMGGSFALTYAATAPPGLQAAAVNYGGVTKRREALKDVCPIVASYGARDRVFGREATRLREHLEALGIEHDVKRYEQAGHSFMTDGSHPVGRLVFLPMRIAHEPQAAHDAWARVFDFFDRHVQTPAAPGAPAPSASS